MVKDVNEDLIKVMTSLLQLLQQILVLDPGIPVIEAGPILFRIPAMRLQYLDNIEAAIKEHGLS